MKPIYYLYAKAFSDFSSRMQFIGLTSVLLLSEHPELYLMLFYLGRQIGGVLVSYLAGVVADRYSRRRTMILSELASGFALSSLIFIEHPVFIVAIAFILGITYTFFMSVSGHLSHRCLGKSAYQKSIRFLCVLER